MMSASISRESASRCGGGGAAATFGAGGGAVVFGINFNDGISMQPSERQIRKCVASPATAGVASKQTATATARMRFIILSLDRKTQGVPAGSPTERLRGSAVDDQIDFGGLLHGQILRR